jgi:hypothetical protein
MRTAAARPYGLQGDVMRRFLLLSVATAATMLAVAACGDLTGVSDELVGTYQLRTIGGQPVPVVGVPVTYSGGELELDGDGMFDRTYQTSVSGGLPSEIHIFGTWERIGSAIRFETNDGGTRYYGEFKEPDIIVIHDEDGNNWEYER